MHHISVTSNRKGINNPTLAAMLRRTVKTALSAEGMDLPTLGRPHTVIMAVFVMFIGDPQLSFLLSNFIVSSGITAQNR